MKFVTLNELGKDASKVLERLNEEDIVVTRDGKPAAALLYLDQELLDDFILTHHPELLREVQEAQAEYEQEGGIDHEAMKRLVEEQ